MDDCILLLFDGVDGLRSRVLFVMMSIVVLLATIGIDFLTNCCLYRKREDCSNDDDSITAAILIFSPSMIVSSDDDEEIMVIMNVTEISQSVNSSANEERMKQEVHDFFVLEEVDCFFRLVVVRLVVV